MNDLKEGWVSLINSRKYHYVRDGITLCKKFMYPGKSYEPDTGATQKDDCAGCVRVLRADSKNKPAMQEEKP